MSATRTIKEKVTGSMTLRFPKELRSVMLFEMMSFCEKITAKHNFKLSSKNP